ncbi:hypothetical protein F8388_007490 [Cannabis sativa]|uniref:non-specific serine/threonine protein kinase n=1 Tax=Cannabis sativa TaxID=3483 RepID=A0A7J6F4L9_CANSA|nr:hypothetical protein F8388_007490 [Cannabis sativa]
MKGIDLRKNLLTGSLSPSIGNLTRMQYLSFGINALSGEVPKELGQLTEQITLSFSSNNFSGPLPPELGNLSKLQELYIISSGVSGEIPSTFANLLSLQVLWASDTELTGKIPEFIGNWSNLNTLRLSEISNASTSLSFITNMKSLSILVLKNINVIGTIPSNISELKELQHLLLGNNSLNGTLPQQKSESLLNIDVSYNNLVGTIPSWVNKQNLHINLVGNNFTIDNSNNSTLLSGLICLQKDFPCNRDHYNFGINSGGKQITSSNGLVYEKDDEALGPADYFVTSSKRWAVSNVGIFLGNNNATYTSNSFSQFTNTLDPELFQTTRLSASSLRYYGLGLENGNYTVKLQFAEIGFENYQTWKGLGRRIFDIYIQGKLEIKDFDIKKEAGAVPLRAVQKEFKARVSQNYLEIHLYWAGKGTCCIPARSTYGPSISAISATPTFYVVQRRKKSRTNDDDEEFLGMDVKPFTFGYAELRTATNDFDYSKKLGEGGFGPVYKAWDLHEEDREIELVDSKISKKFNREEVRRTIRVAFLCTQASPAARPSMSKVVAMLSGDTDAGGTEVSRPGYLVDWKFNDANTLMSQIEQGTTDPMQCDSCVSTSMVAMPSPSHNNPTHPMLQDINNEL